MSRNKKQKPGVVLLTVKGHNGEVLKTRSGHLILVGGDKENPEINIVTREEVEITQRANRALRRRMLSDARRETPKQRKVK